MKRFAFVLFFLLGVHAANAGAEKSWTVLVFLNGENSLWRAAIDDFNEMEVVGSTDDVNVLVQIDMPVSMFGSPPFNDTRRYYIDRDPGGDDSGFVSTQVWPESGTRELDMGSASVLSDFVIWGIDNYPADHYLVVIWNHGDGWRASPYETGEPFPLKEISDDETSGSSISIARGELEEAMAAVTGRLGRKIDVLGLDACLMGMWEVDVVLEDYADYVVQSEETENEEGYDYTALMNRLAGAPLSSAETVCASVVEDSIESVGSTLSCIDLGRIGAVSTGVDNLAAAVMDAMDTAELGLRAAAGDAVRFGDGDFADLYNFTERLIAAAALPASVHESAGALQDALDDAIVSSEARGRYRNARGISIYLPASDECLSYDELYTEGSGTLWTGYRWDEMICSFSCVICAPDAYEIDDTHEEAKEILVGEVQERNLYPLHDLDHVLARVVQGTEYSFFTGGDVDMYMVLQRFEDHRQIARDDDSGSEKNALITWTADADDFVFLKVLHWGTTVGYGAETGAYTLHMVSNNCDPALAPACNTHGVCDGTLRVCEDGAWGCDYPPEFVDEDAACDGLDNNCDGLVDEGYAPFTCGLGECVSESICMVGLEDCLPREPQASADLACDGLDEDCDGLVDEDADCTPCAPENAPECMHDGVCTNTIPSCTDGEWDCDYPETYSETDDNCDGVDNNCNGRIDEDRDCDASDAVIRPSGSGVGCSIMMVR
ncbi:MAG: clostripain-related cysteine peptidase [Pseudomonadota bacterium]